MIPGLASENPQMAIELFESFEPDLQGRIRPRFLEGLVDNDIALATDYLYDSSDPEKPNWRPMDQLARQIEKDQGLDSTIEWAAELPEGSLRSNAWSAAYAVWGSKDPHAAAEAIAAMPPSADRDQAINGLHRRARAPGCGAGCDLGGRNHEPRLARRRADPRRHPVFPTRSSRCKRHGSRRAACHRALSPAWAKQLEPETSSGSMRRLRSSADGSHRFNSSFL